MVAHRLLQVIVHCLHEWLLRAHAFSALQIPRSNEVAASGGILDETKRPWIKRHAWEVRKAPTAAIAAAPEHEEAVRIGLQLLHDRRETGSVHSHTSSSYLKFNVTM